MKLDKSWHDALDGTTFSGGQAFEIPTDGAVPLRIDVVEFLVRGRNVIHVGCVDHLPLLEQKIADDTWLHARITRVANSCIGVDVNDAGIEALKQRAIENVTVGDVTHPESFVDDESRWDLMVLGEIVEHVDDPVAFLSSIRTEWAGRLDGLIVTLPNAWAWSSLRAVFRRQELVNTDHRYWFTPFTAAKVATCAGFDVVELTMAEYFGSTDTMSPLSRIKQAVLTRYLRRNPLVRSSIVLHLEPLL